MLEAIKQVLPGPADLGVPNALGMQEFNAVRPTGTKIGRPTFNSWRLMSMLLTTREAPSSSYPRLFSPRPLADVENRFSLNSQAFHVIDVPLASIRCCHLK